MQKSLETEQKKKPTILSQISLKSICVSNPQFVYQYLPLLLRTRLLLTYYVPA